jgi:hypothetical protein
MDTQGIEDQQFAYRIAVALRDFLASRFAGKAGLVDSAGQSVEGVTHYNVLITNTPDDVPFSSISFYLVFNHKRV